MFRRVFYFSPSVSTSYFISTVNLTYILYPQFSPLLWVIWLQGWKRKRNVSHSKKERRKKGETKSRVVHILWQALSTWSAGVVWRNYDRLVFTAPPKPTESCQVLRAASNGDLLIRHKDHGTQGQLSTDNARGRIEDERREKKESSVTTASHPQNHKKAFILCWRKN